MNTEYQGYTLFSEGYRRYLDLSHFVSQSVSELVSQSVRFCFMATSHRVVQISQTTSIMCTARAIDHLVLFYLPLAIFFLFLATCQLVLVIFCLLLIFVLEVLFTCYLLNATFHLLTFIIFASYFLLLASCIFLLVTCNL